jgi:hypothetical protein
MPIYYFQQQTGADITEDPEGSELADLQEAQQEAMKSARELLANAIRFSHSAPNRVFVVDENGRELLTVFLIEVLPSSLQKLFRSPCV